MKKRERDRCSDGAGPVAPKRQKAFLSFALLVMLFSFSFSSSSSPSSPFSSSSAQFKIQNSKFTGSPTSLYVKQESVALCDSEAENKIQNSKFKIESLASILVKSSSEHPGITCTKKPPAYLIVEASSSLNTSDKPTAEGICSDFAK